MSLPDFEALLKREIGLDASTIGSSSVTRAVAVRMSATAIDSLENYHQLVLQSSTELQQLIEAVVVPETWFFRDREAFIAMTSFARERRQLNQGPFHVLSIPCSTGEEPHSMAMALLTPALRANSFASTPPMSVIGRWLSPDAQSMAETHSVVPVLVFAITISRGPRMVTSSKKSSEQAFDLNTETCSIRACWQRERPTTLYSVETC